MVLYPLGNLSTNTTNCEQLIWKCVQCFCGFEINRFHTFYQCCLTCLWNLKIFALFLEIHDIFILISLLKSSKIYVGLVFSFFNSYIFLKYAILNHNKNKINFIHLFEIKCFFSCSLPAIALLGVCACLQLSLEGALGVLIVISKRKRIETTLNWLLCQSLHPQVAKLPLSSL